MECLRIANCRAKSPWVPQELKSNNNVYKRGIPSASRCLISLRKPEDHKLVASAQFTSDDWQASLKAHGMAASMSRRGNCHDNAVAESFFNLLKKERIKRRIYPNRATAASDVFDYIEIFYNPIRPHSFAADLSPVEFERRYAQSGS